MKQLAFFWALLCFSSQFSMADTQSLTSKADAKTVAELQGLPWGEALPTLVTLRGLTNEEIKELKAIAPSAGRMSKLQDFCRQRILAVMGLGCSAWLSPASMQANAIIHFTGALLSSCQMTVNLNLAGAELISENSEITNIMSNRTIATVAGP